MADSQAVKLYRVCILIDNPIGAARETQENIPGARLQEIRHFGKSQMMVSFTRPTEITSKWGVTDTDRYLVCWFRRSLSNPLFPLMEFNVYEGGNASWPPRVGEDKMGTSVAR